MFFRPVVIATACISILLSSSVEAVAITSASSFSSTVARNATSTISSSSTNVPTNTTSLYAHPNSTIFSSTLVTPSPTRKNTTASQTGWYTFTNSTANAGTPTPEPALLSPATPPGLDRHDPVVLQPYTSVSLFYQSPAPANASGKLSPIPIPVVPLLRGCLKYIVLAGLGKSIIELGRFSKLVRAIETPWPSPLSDVFCS